MSRFVETKADIGAAPGANPAHGASKRKRGMLRRLLSNENGAAMMEFALVVGPFIGLIMAALETSLLFFAQQALETASERTSRDLLIGFAQKSTYTQAQFKAGACADLPAFMKCDNLFVDVQVANSFATANLALPAVTFDPITGKPTATTGYNPGTAGDIVVMKVMYVWQMAPGPLGFNMSNLPNGKRLLVSTAVFKTEPYNQVGAI
jgi:Flp pilus assembly protein TadG